MLEYAKRECQISEIVLADNLTDPFAEVPCQEIRNCRSFDIQLTLSAYSDGSSADFRVGLAVFPWAAQAGCIHESGIWRACTKRG